jgi:hypothetical protein
MKEFIRKSLGKSKKKWSHPHTNCAQHNFTAGRHQATVTIHVIFTSPIGESQKRVVFKILTTFGSGQSSPFLAPSVVVIGQITSTCLIS